MSRCYLAWRDHSGCVCSRNVQDDGHVLLRYSRFLSIQARRRIHDSLPPAPGGRPQRVEHEYERRGCLAYLAALDVHSARIFGRCEPKSGIAPFDRLVEQVMLSPPYCCAKRVFWIVDNRSSHPAKRASID